MINLLLYDRPAVGSAFRGNITHLIPDWSHTTRAVGGYWSAGGTITGMPPAEMANAFQQWVGRLVVEYTMGMISWAGLIWQMDLVSGGVNYRVSLDEKSFANKIKTLYRQPVAVDEEQGNLSYTTESGDDTFTDDGQDFSDWETTSGDALYKIEVTHSDGTRAWAYLGAKVSNTEIYVYEDVDLSDKGWNANEDSHPDLGKTPSSYVILACPESGDDEAGQSETAWSTDSDSVAEFYTRELILSEGEMPVFKATDLRDQYLEQYGWPRSRMVGGLALEGARVEDQPGTLTISALGVWHTLNFQHCESDLSGTATALITAALANCDYVTAGRIEHNYQPNKFKCSQIAMRYGDIIEAVIRGGDLNNAVWQGGVYADEELVFEAAPTTVEYYLRGGRLVDKDGSPVIPSLLEPGFLLRNGDAPVGWQPPGTTDPWNDPQVAYVDAVTFRAPRGLELRFLDEEESIVALEQDIERQSQLHASQVGWV